MEQDDEALDTDRDGDNWSAGRSLTSRGIVATTGIHNLQSKGYRVRAEIVHEDEHDGEAAGGAKMRQSRIGFRSREHEFQIIFVATCTNSSVRYPTGTVVFATVGGRLR